MSSRGVAEVADLDVHRRERSNQAVSVKMTDATMDMLREASFESTTVSDVATRAGVSASTAHRLFSSKDELVVAACLRRIQTVALSDKARSGSPARAAEQLRRMMLVVAEEPAIASACTAVFLHSGLTADRAREHIGLEIHRLISSAMGPGSWPEVITTLEFVFSGALIQAAAGATSYQRAADGVEAAVSLILAGLPPQ